MNYNIGDKVRFLDDVGEGTISKILANNRVLVLDNDGFETPVFTSNLVLVNDVRSSTNFPVSAEAATPQEEAKPAPAPLPVSTPPVPPAAAPAPQPEPAAADKERDAEGSNYELSIAFLQPKNEQIELYLLNDSPYQLCYTLTTRSQQGLATLWAYGQVASDSKTLVKLLPLTEVRRQVTVQIEVLFFKNVDFVPVASQSAVLSLSPTDFFKINAFKESEFFDDKSLIYKMLSNQNTPSQMVQVVSSLDKKIPLPNTEEPDVTDLREAVLRLQRGFMTETQLLQTQIDLASAGIDALLQKGSPGQRVLVYGLGNKTIRQTLQDLLEKQYPHLRWQDASHKQYHYGAIMVSF
ncbi:mannonate oxidoreductase [Bacteroidia bacterium]|nr:mannonate oxidoreductase [Bacteroidia bacterium]